MGRAGQGDLRPDEHVLSDGDGTDIQRHEIVIDIGAVADKKMAAVITMEVFFDHHILPQTSQQPAQQKRPLLVAKRQNVDLG